MMQGVVREYNWQDIERLIFADIGLLTDQEIRTCGEMRSYANISIPEHRKDTCLIVTKFDKPFSERIQDHAGD